MPPNERLSGGGYNDGLLDDHQGATDLLNDRRVFIVDIKSDADGSPPPKLRRSESISLGKLMVSRDSVVLGLNITALIMSGTIGSVMFKKMTNDVHYPYVLFLFTTLLAVPFYFTKLAISKWRGQIDWETCTSCPKRSFLLPAALDAIGSLLLVFGGSGTCGPLQSLLFQTCIPVTMVGSRVLLKRKFSSMQILSAGIIIAGVGTSLYPQLAVADGHTDNSVFWNAIYVIAVIPLALSSLAKERLLVNWKVDIFYMQAWVSVFQVLVGVLCFPVNSIPGLGNVAFGEIPSMIESAVVKIMEVFECKCADYALVFVLGYAFCNFWFNIFSLNVVRQSSASLMMTANTVRLPLVNLAFHFQWVMGSDASSFSVFNLIGLIAILGGLLSYRVSELRFVKAMSRKKRAEQLGEERMLQTDMELLSSLGVTDSSNTRSPAQIRV